MEETEMLKDINMDLQKQIYELKKQLNDRPKPNFEVITQLKDKYTELIRETEDLKRQYSEELEKLRAIHSILKPEK